MNLLKEVRDKYKNRQKAINDDGQNIRKKWCETKLEILIKKNAEKGELEVTWPLGPGIYDEAVEYVYQYLNGVSSNYDLNMYMKKAYNQNGTINHEGMTSAHKEKYENRFIVYRTFRGNDPYLVIRWKDE